MTQSISGCITNLLAGLQTVYASTKGTDDQPVAVVLGRPGQYQPNAIVAVAMAVRTPIERMTISTNRSRETRAEIDSVISVYVPGDESSQPIAIAAALDMQAQLETYLRTKPNEVLGGACRDSYVSNAVLEPDVAYQTFDDPNVAPVATGRLASITVTVTAFVRY